MNASLLVLVLVLAGNGVDPVSCKGALDAVTTGDARCRGPAHEAVPVVADEKPPPEALVRDPAMFPGELGFVATVLGLVGGGAMVGASATDPRRLSASDAAVQSGVFWAGASLVGLAGLVGAGALSTWVFDPSTGALRLPLFRGEER